MTANTTANPLLQAWDTPFEAPPFERFRPEHFRGAFEPVMAEQRAEVDAITANPEAASFANTIEAMERSGRALNKVCAVFFNLTGAHTSDELEAIERDVTPALSRHSSAISLDAKLYARIADLWARRDEPGLSAEQARLLERTHTSFVRSGAALPAEGKARLAAISERLATLGTQFSQNVLADEKSYALVLDGEQDLAGLPDFLRASAAKAAEDRGLSEKHVITLGRSSIEPFLQFSSRRDLRETAFKAWIARGEGGGESDNRAIIAEMVALRAERARLLGFDNFAAYRLDDSMARTPDAALELLRSVWDPAQRQAIRERAVLQELAQTRGGNFELEAWDYRFYAEQRRREEFDLDESEIKPYLQLEKIIAAAFDVAGRLFGLSFAERHDLPRYHPDVRAWEVTRDGKPVALFYGDYFARTSKRSGAWMSSFRGQRKLDGEVRPIIVNVMNFAKAAEGEPTLLSFDDARTLFHEFGHALHGMLSDVTYPSLAGTNVSRDFVEFPSQLFEHWFEQPQILRQYAVHYRTGEPMPEALLKRVLAARNFNQGHATVEYVSSALVDFDFHLLPASENLDPAAFERAALDKIGMPAGMVMRHRPPHFTHIFSGGYSAAYYSYLWSEVLDADGFGAFEEAGDIFDPETAKRLHDYVYSAGSLRDPAEAYQAFRGRVPDPQHLLRRRGLIEVPVQAEL